MYSLRTFPGFSVNFPVFVGCYPDFCTLEVGRYGHVSFAAGNTLLHKGLHILKLLH